MIECSAKTRQKELESSSNVKAFDVLVIGGRTGRMAKIKLARISEHIARQRDDFLHKTSNRLVNSYSLIAYEELKFNICEREIPHPSGWDESEPISIYTSNASIGMPKVMPVPVHQFIS